jgi:hypothetical protein
MSMRRKREIIGKWRGKFSAIGIRGALEMKKISCTMGYKS